MMVTANTKTKTRNVHQRLPQLRQFDGKSGPAPRGNCFGESRSALTFARPDLSLALDRCRDLLYRKLDAEYRHRLVDDVPDQFPNAHLTGAGGLELARLDHRPARPEQLLIWLIAVNFS